MKISNINTNKKSHLWFMAVVFSLFTSSAFALSDKHKSDEVIKTEVRQFFDAYLGTYNQRFGHPEKVGSFIDALSGLIHDPFLMAPPNVAPFQPQDLNQMIQIFDGFVQSLERKGAIKLVWKSVNLQVLSPGKVLANNIGIAIDDNGEVVYETISIYLLYREKETWKIALFSPYDLDRRVVLMP